MSATQTVEELAAKIQKSTAKLVQKSVEIAGPGASVDEIDAVYYELCVADKARTRDIAALSLLRRAPGRNA